MIAVVLVVWGVGIYNKLVELKNRFQNAFSQIEVQLKRRYDLIPNLVETAKGYMAHEKGTLEAVIQARNQAVSGLSKAVGQPGRPGRDAGAGRGGSGLERRARPAVRAVRGVSRPQGQQNMAQLSEEITSTENKVAFARQAYNDAVMTYNTYRQTFPPILFASFLGHGQDAELLDFDDAQIAEAPKVSFT